MIWTHCPLVAWGATRGQLRWGSLDLSRGGIEDILSKGCCRWSRKRKGKPRRRSMDVAKEDIQRAGVTEEDGGDGVRWRQTVHCGNLFDLNGSLQFFTTVTWFFLLSTQISFGYKISALWLQFELSSITLTLIKNQTKGLRRFAHSVGSITKNHLARYDFLFWVCYSQNDSWYSRLHSLYLIISEDIHICTKNNYNYIPSETSEWLIRQQWIYAGIWDARFMFLISFSPRFHPLSTPGISGLERAWICMSHWVFYNNCCPSKHFHKFDSNHCLLHWKT